MFIPNIIRDAFTYTKYDELGRAIETGESSYTSPSQLTSMADDMTRPAVTNAVQAYQTVYTTDAAVTYEPSTARSASQRYLRNRVSYTRAADGSNKTYYSYDPHGNVEWIIQKIRGLGENYIRYQYDLVSNNVLEPDYHMSDERRERCATHAMWAPPKTPMPSGRRRREGVRGSADAPPRVYSDCSNATEPRERSIVNYLCFPTSPGVKNP